VSFYELEAEDAKESVAETVRSRFLTALQAVDTIRRGSSKLPA